MRPRHYSYSREAASNTSIAALQTLAGAGSLTLDGTYGTTGFTSGLAWNLTLTSANNLSARTFTVNYIDAQGNAQSTTSSGPNATTLATSIYVSQVTSITVDGAVTEVSVGHAQVGYGPWKGLPMRLNTGNSSASIGIGGTANVGLEVTYANIADNTVFAGTFDSFDHEALQSLTASDFASLETRVIGCRLKINSWTSGAIRLDLAVAAEG